MRFYGQFDPPVDQFIFERYFPDINIQGTFVECGAFDGLLECSCKFFEETMGWRGYNLEPVPWIYESLQKNRPDACNLNVALSNKNGETSFKAVLHPALDRYCTNGSICHMPSHQQALEEIGCEFEEIVVNTMTWQHFTEVQKIAHIDLLVLDVEGHELSVIEGMFNSKVLPDIICIEVGHIPLDTVKNALYKLGYLYDITSHVNAYFIKTEKLGMFALRRTVNYQEYVQQNLSPPIFLSDEAVMQLEKEKKEFQVNIEVLSNLYTEIVNSKGWRFVERLRSLKLKLRKLLFPFMEIIGQNH